MVSINTKCGPGQFAPARFLCTAFLLGTLLVPQQAGAQSRGAQAPPRAPAAAAPAPQRPQMSLPLPDNLVTSKLLWSTMAAMDHASDTGNFTVVNALGTAGFRTRNTPAALASIFTTLRNERVDLSDALLVSPTFQLPPHMVTPTAFRMRGIFPLRPTSVAFDLVFAWESGWRVDAIAVLPLAASVGR
jgi:hypothetical protein